MKHGVGVDGQGLVGLADEALFEEVARRLKRRFQQETGCEFRFGRFEFIFHDGRFQGIEENRRSKRYQSPSRFKDAAGSGSVASAG